MQYVLRAFIALVVAGPAPALAAPLPVGPEFQVNTYTTSSQGTPAVAPDGSGGFVVVWQSIGSAGTDSSGSSVQAQRFASTGMPVGPQFQVNTHTTAYQFSPVVASVGGNRFVVVWVAEEGGGGTDTDGWSIQAQRFASTGAPVGPEFQVNTYTTGNQQYPDVGPDGSGGFVVVWSGYGSSGSDTDLESVQAQRFASTGMPVGPQFQVNTYTTYGQRDPAVASDGGDGFVVVWMSAGSSGTDADGYSVQAQRFAPTGAPVGLEFQVNSHTTGDQIAPAVAPDGNGGFVVVWQSGAPYTAAPTSIRGQQFTSTGLPAGSEFLVKPEADGLEWNPAIGPDGSGGFVVVWDSQDSSPTDASTWSVQGRGFASTGEPIGSQFQVNTYTTSEQRDARVAADGSGGFVVVWTSDGSTGTDTDLHSVQAQRFEEVGTTTTTTIPVLAGDGRGRPERDCYIGLGGYTEADLVPINKKGTKRGIRCTECDPACDLDGVAAPNGICTFMVSACINNAGVEGCDPGTRTPKKVRARAKSKAGKLDLGSMLPDDLTAACNAPMAFDVPVKGKRQNKPGKGKVLLKATKPMDRDKFVFVCDPRPPGEACTTTTTTMTTTSTTTSTTIPAPGPCTGGDDGKFCDLGNGTIFDGWTGLQWEQKDTDVGSGMDPGNLHDVDNVYSWAGACSALLSKKCQPNLAAEMACKAQTDVAYWGNGCEQCGATEGTCASAGSAITTVWDWLSQVNTEGGTGFAGYTDWRLPSQSACNDCHACHWSPYGGYCECRACEAHELESLSPGGYYYVLWPWADDYWSATTVNGDPSKAWALIELSGALPSEKASASHVRAVR